MSTEVDPLPSTGLDAEAPPRVVDSSNFEAENVGQVPEEADLGESPDNTGETDQAKSADAGITHPKSLLIIRIVVVVLLIFLAILFVALHFAIGIKRK